MPFKYTNKRHTTHYLHEGTTKKGNPKYYFSTKTEGKLLDKIPEGYEVYEHPANGRVFLRRIQPKLITDKEKHTVDKRLKRLTSPRRYIYDIKKRIITIYESNQDIDRLKELFGQSTQYGLRQDETALMAVIDKAIDYTPVLRFIVEDDEKRTFIAERYCFLGSVEDWIHIGGPDPLGKLFNKFIKHLGYDSFYDLY